MYWSFHGVKAQVFAYYGIFKTLKNFSYFEIFRRPDPSKARQFPISMFLSHACFFPPTVFTKSGRIWFRFVKTFTCNHWLLTVQYWVGNFKFWPISLLFGWAGKRWPDIRTHLQASRERKVSKVVQRSDGYAMLMSPHTDEPQRGRNSCLWLQSRSVLSSFGVVLMSCRVNFHVVQSALQYSACRI